MNRYLTAAAVLLALACTQDLQAADETEEVEFELEIGPRSSGAPPQDKAAPFGHSPEKNAAYPLFQALTDGSTCPTLEEAQKAYIARPEDGIRPLIEASSCAQRQVQLSNNKLQVMRRTPTFVGERKRLAQIDELPVTQSLEALNRGDIQQAITHRNNALAMRNYKARLPIEPDGLPTISVDAPQMDMPELDNTIRETTSRSFWSNFSAGLIVNFKKEADADVKSATVTATTTDGLGNTTPGLIQVDQADPIKAGLGLEAHRFMWGWTFGDTGPTFERAIALGPYVSIVPGATDVVDVIGAGILVGFLGDSKIDKQGARVSMNIGLGYFLDFNSVKLEEGFIEGSELPDGENVVRLRQETDEGLQLVISFTARTM